ncbi:MAG: GGDEF domain-containing protein [Planctomycetaceae bacterium]|nr:GGDEF domain-containing protein [Planctomycetaceae bacterium]MCA9066577.1 GGDEF domain-containing protein [Planctomycetaceae bacterium]
MTARSTTSMAVDADTSALAKTCPEETRYFDNDAIRADAAAPGRGCLIQIYPAVADAQLVRLQRPATLIGRDPACDIVLDQTAVSRRHAAVEQCDTGYRVRDLNSTNGTFLDDQLIREEHLQGGELIRIGGTILKFMSSLDEEAHYHTVVRELMTRDPLTSTFNRSYLIPTLSKTLTGSRNTDVATSLILADIDHFKSVNDTWGHLVGDEVLRIFCERVRQVLRQNDLLARLGGEEFAVLCQGTQRNDAMKAAERIRLAIANEKFRTQAGSLEVTCSLGVTSVRPGQRATVDDVLADADHWLYVAKKAGRNCVRSAANC